MAWRFYDSFFLCNDGEEAPYRDNAMFLDRAITSVRAAAEELCLGNIECADDFCVVLADVSKEFYVLYRQGKRQVAISSLGLNDEGRKGWVERGDDNAGTFEELLLELEAERTRTAEVEEMLRQSAETGQLLLTKIEELEQEKQRLKIKELHWENEELLRQLEEQENAAFQKTDGEEQKIVSFMLDEREKPIDLHKRAYDETIKEWEDRLQQETLNQRELQNRHEHLNKQHDRLKVDHAQLLESERHLQQSIEKLLAQENKKENRTKERKHSTKTTSFVGRRSRTSIVSDVDKQDDNTICRYENVNLKLDNSNLREQIMDLEARCLQLEEEAEGVQQEMMAHEQEKESLKATSNELKGMLEQTRRQKLMIPVQRRSTTSNDNLTSEMQPKRPLLGVQEDAPGQQSMCPSMCPRSRFVDGRRVLCECPCVCIRLCILSLGRGPRETEVWEQTGMRPPHVTHPTNPQ